MSNIVGTPEEVYATLEKDLIRQVQICDRNREYFTRLGDVGQTTKYETQASALKKDLVALRQAAKCGDPLPRYTILFLFVVILHFASLSINLTGI